MLPVSITLYDCFSVFAYVCAKLLTDLEKLLLITCSLEAIPVIMKTEEVKNDDPVGNPINTQSSKFSLPLIDR